MKNLLAAAAALACAQGQTLVVEDSGVEVRSGKDAFIFSRGAGDDGGPQSLVLRDENLFVTVAATTDADDGTEFDWTLDTAGVSWSFEPAIAFGGQVLFATPFGFDDDTEYFKITETGTQAVSFAASVANITDVATAETELLVISPFMSVFPLLVVITLAVLSKNVYVAMFFGIWVGAYIAVGGDMVESFRLLVDQFIINQVIDEYNYRVIFFSLTLAGLLGMVKRSGGQEGLSNAMASFAKGVVPAQLSTVTGGVLLFFDDYSSALILGATFKPIMDRFHVCREKLAFVVDSTSAPIASLAPISSWIAFELGNIGEELQSIQGTGRFLGENETLPGAYSVFIQTIPSRFYPWFMLVLQVTLILAASDFGPMLLAERKTRVYKRIDGGDAAVDLQIGKDATSPDDNTPKSAINFLFPIGAFIIVLLVSMVNIGQEYAGADGLPLTAQNVFGNTDAFYSLVYATMGTSVLTIFFYLVQTKKNGRFTCPSPSSIYKGVWCFPKKDTADYVKDEGVASVASELDNEARPLLYLTESVNAWIEGFKDLVPAVVILGLAFAIKDMVKAVATDRFFTNVIVSGGIAPEMLPTITFIISSLLSFCTGTSWGTMSIMFPLVSFATWEVSEGDETLLITTMSSILSGAIFGDHCSILSDTTILSSIGAGCSVGAHVYTQLPYAVWGAIFAIIVGTLPTGAGAPAIAMLIIGALLFIVATVFLAVPVISPSGRWDVLTKAISMCTGSDIYDLVGKDTRDLAAAEPELASSDFFGRLFGYSAPEADAVVASEEKAPAPVEKEEVEQKSI